MQILSKNETTVFTHSCSGCGYHTQWQDYSVHFLTWVFAYGLS